METLISTMDLLKVKAFNGTWYANYNKSSKTYYVKGYRMRRNKKEYVQLHRYITRCPEGKVIDHRDRDTLNNTRENLKVTTYSGNNKNRKSWAKPAKV